MAKRLVDTDLWQKEWFGELPIKLKLLVFYIFCNCDCAGVFEPNYRNLNFFIGDKITEADILSIKQIQKLPNGKFYLGDFIRFQYGVSEAELNPKFSVHKGVIRILEKNGILQKANKDGKSETVLEQFRNCYNVTVQDKDKDKDKDKDINITNKLDINQSIYNSPKKTKKIYGEFRNVSLTDEEYAKLDSLYNGRIKTAIETLSSYIASSGKKYKSHYAVLGKHNWVYKKVCPDNIQQGNKNDILRQVSEAF